MFEVRIDAIASTLEELRSLSRSIFGDKGPKYLLNPCMTLEEVEAFEAQHAVRLPEDYRCFLLRLGNGAANRGVPYALNDAARGRLLARPFPLVAAYAPGELQAILKEYQQELQEISDDLHQYNPHELHELIADQLYEWTSHGALRLEWSPDRSDLLVVTGPEHGKIWFQERFDRGSIRPAGMSFLDWYEAGLAEQMHYLRRAALQLPMKD